MFDAVRCDAMGCVTLCDALRYVMFVGREHGECSMGCNAMRYVMFIGREHGECSMRCVSLRYVHWESMESVRYHAMRYVNSLLESTVSVRCDAMRFGTLCSLLGASSGSESGQRVSSGSFGSEFRQRAAGSGRPDWAAGLSSEFGQHWQRVQS